jgi:hypothetical protein
MIHKYKIIKVLLMIHCRCNYNDYVSNYIKYEKKNYIYI